MPPFPRLFFFQRRSTEGWSIENAIEIIEEKKALPWNKEIAFDHAASERERGPSTPRSSWSLMQENAVGGLQSCPMKPPSILKS